MLQRHARIVGKYSIIIRAEYYIFVPVVLLLELSMGTNRYQMISSTLVVGFTQASLPLFLLQSSAPFLLLLLFDVLI